MNGSAAVNFQSSVNDLIESWKNSPYPSTKLSTYFPVYAELFGHLRNTKCTFIETGTLGGGSLFMWRKWLGAEARIIGIDLNPDARRWQGHGFEIFIGDQGDPEFWKNTLSEVGQFDALLDDGGHQSFQQIVTVVEAIKHLKRKAIVVVEDTHASFMRDFSAHGMHSFLEYAKDSTDVLTARAAAIYPDRFNKVVNEGAVNQLKSVFSIHFYTSVVAFKVDPGMSMCPEEKWNENKGAVSDFRYLGKDSASVIWPNPFVNEVVTVKGRGNMQVTQQAVAAYQEGRWKEAERLCRQLIKAKIDDLDMLLMLGLITAQTKRTQEAAELFAKAIAVDSNHVIAHNNLGNALRELDRPEEAVACFDQAIKIKPDYVGAYSNRGAALCELRRFEDALESCDCGLKFAPDYADAHNNRGNALQGLGRYAESVESYQRALTIRPDYADAHNNLGNALRMLGRDEEALDSFTQALHFRPDHQEAYNSRGVLLSQARRYEEALDSFRLAVKLNPRNAEAFNNRGNLLHDLRRYEEALEAYDQALAINPAYASAHSNRGNVLLELKRSEEALQAFARVVELDPQYRFGKGKLLHAKMLCCDWSGYDSLCRSVVEDLHAGRKSAEPFGYQGISASVADLHRCATLYADDRFPPAEKKLWNPGRAPNPKIRIGYLSGEFRTQATSILMAELFEVHDKSRFEIFAFDNGWDDGSALRARLNAAFDGIIDITGLGDVEAARRISDMNIDILVNLNGYFGRGRQGVFSYRPSPVQVNYLGFPGTIGADYIDYLIADATVIPESDRAHYAEKIAYLPDCYQVNDSKRPIAGKMFTRQELGLPEDAFVYCCFNNNYKITPDTFDQWMRILHRVPKGVLWLFEDNPAASRNLRKEAQRRGVDPGRLIFAGRMPPDEHLARHRVADLFLDTLPYNAHTTASDALWAGLPVLTCLGTTFPGRVAASLLNTMGLQQLVTRSPEDYVEQAVALAADPVRMSGLRDVLEAGRRSSPLFDTPRFARHIENAYRQMLGRQRAGLPADHLSVQG